MNRIEKKFNELKNQGKKALITYVTCGDGGYEATETAVFEMERAGADIIELGVPFSDPIAEGPVIQAASIRALSGGATLAGIFDMIKRIRKKTDIPLVLMLYLNSIFGFGTERFFEICGEIGIDGVIVPDMPYEEKEEIQPFADNYNFNKSCDSDLKGQNTKNRFVRKRLRLLRIVYRRDRYEVIFPYRFQQIYFRYKKIYRQAMCNRIRHFKRSTST